MQEEPSENKENMASSPAKGAINGTESKPPLASLASWVRLNVGGTVFATTVTTLAKDPDSFLYRICRTDDKDYLDSHKVRNILICNVCIYLLSTYNLTFLIHKEYRECVNKATTVNTTVKLRTQTVTKQALCK